MPRLPSPPCRNPSMRLLGADTTAGMGLPMLPRFCHPRLAATKHDSVEKCERKQWPQVAKLWSFGRECLMYSLLLALSVALSMARNWYHRPFCHRCLAGTFHAGSIGLLIRYVCWTYHLKTTNDESPTSTNPPRPIRLSSHLATSHRPVFRIVHATLFKDAQRHVPLKQCHMLQQQQQQQQQQQANRLAHNMKIHEACGTIYFFARLKEKKSTFPRDFVVAALRRWARAAGWQRSRPWEFWDSRQNSSNFSIHAEVSQKGGSGRLESSCLPAMTCNNARNLHMAGVLLHVQCTDAWLAAGETTHGPTNAFPNHWNVNTTSATKIQKEMDAATWRKTRDMVLGALQLLPGHVAAETIASCTQVAGVPMNRIEQPVPNRIWHEAQDGCCTHAFGNVSAAPSESVRKKKKISTTFQAFVGCLVILQQRLLSMNMTNIPASKYSANLCET